MSESFRAELERAYREMLRAGDESCSAVTWAARYALSRAIRELEKDSLVLMGGSFFAGRLRELLAQLGEENNRLTDEELLQRFKECVAILESNIAEKQQPPPDPRPSLKEVEDELRFHVDRYHGQGRRADEQLFKAAAALCAWVREHKDHFKAMHDCTASLYDFVRPEGEPR